MQERVQEYVSSVITRLTEYRKLAEKTFGQLKEEEFHFQPNEASNSIAIIIQHLHGNMLSRWTNFLTEDGEKKWRQRDKEFETLAYTSEELMLLWAQGWELLFNTLSSLTDNDLHKTVTIRTQPFTVVDAINRQLAHYCYHVGQIVYIGRWIRSSDWKSLSIPKKMPGI